MKMRFFFYIFLSFSPNLLLSQGNILQLEKKFKKTKDKSEKIDLAIKIADELIGSEDLLKGGEFIEKAGGLCREIKCDKGRKANIDLIYSEIQLMMGNGVVMDSLVMPIVSEMDKKIPPFVHARALELTGLFNLINGNIDGAFNYLNQAERILLEQATDKSRLVKVLEYKGFAYNFQSKYDTAIIYARKVTEIYENQRDTMKWISTLNTLSIFQNNYGQTEKSLKILLKIKALIHQYKPEHDIRFSINDGIATAYMEQKQYKQADEVLAATIQEIEGMSAEKQKIYTASLWSAYENRCRVAIYKQDGEKAVEYAKKAMTFLENSPAAFELQRINSKMLLAKAYVFSGDYKLSEEIVTELLKEISKDKLDAFNANIAFVLSEIYLRSDIEPTPFILQQFMAVNERLINQNKGNNNNDELAAQKLKTIFDIYSQDRKLALKSLRNLLLISDTINESALNDARNELLVAYETAEKEKIIERKNLELKQKAIQRNWLFGVAALLLILAIISFLYYKQKKQLAEILEIKVKERTSALEIANKNLEQANYELRTFNYIASHDIKEPIRVIGGYVNLIFKQLPDNLKTNLGTYFDTIKRSTAQLYTLIEDFANYTTLSKNDTIETQAVDLNLLLSNIKDNLYETIKKTQGIVENTTLPTIQTSNALLFTTLKNLIENGLKYNKSETPTVKVDYNKTEVHHEIIVSDNGIGISKQYHDKIFEMFKRLHNRGEYEGSGIGLAIVKLSVEKLGGTVHLKSEEGQGSRFVIMLSIV